MGTLKDYRNELFQNIKEQKKIAKESKKATLYLRDNSVIDISYLYNIKEDIIYCSLSFEDIEKINKDNVQQFKDITIIELKNIKKFDTNDLELISDILFLLNGDRF